MTRFLKDVLDSPESTVWFGIALVAIIAAVGIFGELIVTRPRKK